MTGFVWMTPQARQAEHVDTTSEGSFLRRVGKCRQPGMIYTTHLLPMQREAPVAEQDNSFAHSLSIRTSTEFAIFCPDPFRTQSDPLLRYAVLNRIPNQISRRMHSQLVHHMLSMGFDCPLPNVELLSDLSVRHPFNHQLKHFTLSVRQ